MARFLIISYTRILSDPRVLRQIRALRGHQLTVAGIGRSEDRLPDVEFIHLTKVVGLAAKLAYAFTRFFGLYERAIDIYDACHRGIEALRGREFDAVLANELDSARMAVRVAAGRPMLCDLHEYYLDSDAGRGVRYFLVYRFSDYIIKKYVTKASQVTNVCEPIKRLYMERYGIDSLLVMNQPPYHDLPCRLLKADDKIHLVYHGNAIVTRGLDNLIELMKLLDDRFTLDFVLMPTPLYEVERLKRLSEGVRGIRFREPFQASEIAKGLNESYDIGVSILAPTSTNNRYALPNKFFEFIQARLMVAIGPSEAMASITREYGVGVVADDFKPATMAKILNGITIDQINEYKKRSAAASVKLNSSTSETMIRGIMEGMLPLMSVDGRDGGSKKKASGADGNV